MLQAFENPGGQFMETTLHHSASCRPRRGGVCVLWMLLVFIFFLSNFFFTVPEKAGRCDSVMLHLRAGGQDVEVSAFSECFLSLFFFLSNFFFTVPEKAGRRDSVMLQSSTNTPTKWDVHVSSWKQPYICELAAKAYEPSV